MEEIMNFTPFEDIYKSFLSKITDDMYMELDEVQTNNMLFELLENAIPFFEFPRQDMYDFDTTLQSYNIELTSEEINILATYMVVCWVGQQLATVENTRMKYSGSDFKFTSQANHMAKLISLKEQYEKEGLHLQRLYKRRKKDKNGIMKTTFSDIMNPIKEEE